MSVALIDVNAPESIPNLAQRTVEEADATRPLVPAPSTYRKIITLGNRGRSWYRALQVQVDRSAGALNVMSSYTFAHAEDMVLVPRAELDALRAENRRLRREAGDREALRRIRSDSGDGRTFTREDLAEAWGISE